ncbi:methyltransferase domain-containing protein [Aquibacillus halophilus]|uniref:Methyltransferase domain-containing protein n=1 Tax=Aquibacillus halophilus TaxID=930132 RepID=A0A6A8DJB9_9BACI|nr:class I SAM-dependent methyltransferase [Aquibacillus halophilus]MRH43841.1 methyltransferase domain-containing protein [Aquibacillus halophilus]
MELSPVLYHKLIRPKWSTHKHIHQNVKEHFDLENKKILDFGAGTGANCALCSPSNYYGIDPDMKRISYAQRVYPEYTFNVFKDDKIQLEDSSIDIILIVAVLHHIPPVKIGLYIKEFQRILNPIEGKVIIIEPCFTNEKSISNWFMKNNDNGNHIQDEQGYLDYFERHGFMSKVLKKYRKHFFYNELFFCAY